MHDCQRFREDWIAGEAEDFGDCGECRSFCEEARLILQATDGAAQPMPGLSEYHWNRFDGRLRENLLHQNTARRMRVYWKWGGAAASAAATVAMVVSWGGHRTSQPIAAQAKEEHIQLNSDHIQGLNPTVVNFLGQSEMFLRSFTKIEPSDVEDLAEARDRAKHDLIETGEQRALAADFAPVRIALDEYEGVLRDIKNLDSPEDLADVQTRIQRNGLITNMMAYQPRLSLISLSQR
jgi:hypothetical protein